MNQKECERTHDQNYRRIAEKYRFAAKGVIEVPIDVPWDQSKPAVWLLQEPIVQVGQLDAVMDAGADKIPEHTFEKVQMGYSVWIPVGMGTCYGCEKPYEKGYYQGITWWEWRRRENKTVEQPRELSEP